MLRIHAGKIPTHIHKPFRVGNTGPEDLTVRMGYSLLQENGLVEPEYH